jgi:hypothetical protein
MHDEELLDHHRIRELAYRYARCVDRREYALVGEIFVPEGELVGPGFRVQGLDALEKAVRGIERYEATLHCVHNQSFEIRGDEAEGETYCVANHLYEKQGIAYKLDWGIRYQDRCRREGSGWRFLRRELIVVWEQDLPRSETRP